MTVLPEECSFNASVEGRLVDVEERVDLAIEFALAAGAVTSVMSFGACGDGEADDSEAVQSAIDAVAAAGGGTVLFPPGTYLVSCTEPTYLRDGVNLKGLPGAVITKAAPAAFYTIFASLSCGSTGYGSGVKDVTISGIEFRGNLSTGDTLCAFALHHALRVTVVNCRFIEMHDAGHIFDLNGCSDITIRRCSFIGSRMDGSKYAEAIQMDVSADGAMSYKEKEEHSSSYDGLACQNIIVDECEFLPITVAGTRYPCPTPFGSHSWSQGKYYENIRFTNNHVVDPVSQPFTEVFPPPPHKNIVRGVVHLSACRSVVVSGNLFEQSASSQQHQWVVVATSEQGFSTNQYAAGSSRGQIPALECSDVTISRNTFRGSANLTSVRVQGQTTGRITDVVISENKFFDQPLRSVYVFECRRVTVANNVCAGGSALIRSGDTAELVISDNVISYAQTYPIYLASTNGFTVSGNLVSDCDNAIWAGATSYRGAITGNSVVRSANGIRLSGVNGCAVSGNSVYNGGGSSPNVGIRIYSGSTKCVVVGNSTTSFSTAVSNEAGSSNIVSSNV